MLNWWSSCFFPIWETQQREAWGVHGHFLWLHFLDPFGLLCWLLSLGIKLVSQLGPCWSKLRPTPLVIGPPPSRGTLQWCRSQWAERGYVGDVDSWGELIQHLDLSEHRPNLLINYIIISHIFTYWNGYLDLFGGKRHFQTKILLQTGRAVRVLRSWTQPYGWVRRWARAWSGRLPLTATVRRILDDTVVAWNRPMMYFDLSFMSCLIFEEDGDETKWLSPSNQTWPEDP